MKSTISFIFIFSFLVCFFNGLSQNWLTGGNPVNTGEYLGNNGTFNIPVSFENHHNGMNSEQFAAEFGPSTKVIDVRRPSEYAAEHVNEAYSRPLDAINDWFSALDDNETFTLHCAGGYRSMIAASILKARGIHNFKEVEGGFRAISKTAVPKTDFVCQSKTTV